MVSLLTQRNPFIKQILSWKTRPLRPGEQNGVDYHHVSVEEFESGVLASEFLEYANVHDANYYGTKKKDLLDALNEWGFVIKEMDIQGLKDLSENHPDIFKNSFRIFLEIDDETIRERILARAPMEEKHIQYRLHSAHEERTNAKDLCSVVISAQPWIEDVYTMVKEAIQKYCDSVSYQVEIK